VGAHGFLVRCLEDGDHVVGSHGPIGLLQLQPVFEARVSVALNSDRWSVFCSSEPLVGSRFEARSIFQTVSGREILGS
jgi:hypothetical protein